MTDRLKQLQEFLKESPNDSFLIYATTLEYLKIGNRVEARNGFERLINEHPNYVGTYYHYAKFLEEEGERDSAILYYEKGMDIARQEKNNHALGELQRALQNLLMDED